jgi:hypothetical protein
VGVGHAADPCESCARNAADYVFGQPPGRLIVATAGDKIVRPNRDAVYFDFRSFYITRKLMVG